MRSSPTKPSPRGGKEGLVDSNGHKYLGEELDRIVDYVRDEFDMSYAEVAGLLNYKAFLLMREAEQTEEEGDG